MVDPHSLLSYSVAALEGASRSLQPITRVCLVGRLAPGAAAASFSSWCQAFTKPPAQLTGLLLLLPTGWLQIVEGPPADVVSFVRAMEAQLAPGEHLSVAKVVSTQEDVRERFYPGWSSKSVSVVRTNYTDISESEAALSAMLADTTIGARAPPAARALPESTLRPCGASVFCVFRHAQDWAEAQGGRGRHRDRPVGV